MLVVVVGVFRQSAEPADLVDAEQSYFNLLPSEPDYGVFRDE